MSSSKLKRSRTEKEQQSSHTKESKRSRWDVKELSKVGAIPKESDTTDNVTLDTKVECFICGRKGPLRRLANHQMTAHSALQLIPSEPKAVTCMFCNYAMPSSSLERHLMRKHPAEYSKLQKQKSTQNLAASNHFVNTAINRPNSFMNSVMEKVPKNHQVPTILKGVSKKEPKLEENSDLSSSQTIVIKNQSQLSVEEDDDGYFDLVITQFDE